MVTAIPAAAAAYTLSIYIAIPEYNMIDIAGCQPYPMLRLDSRVKAQPSTAMSCVAASSTNKKNKAVIATTSACSTLHEPRFGMLGFITVKLGRHECTAVDHLRHAHRAQETDIPLATSWRYCKSLQFASFSGWPNIWTMCSFVHRHVLLNS